MKFLYQNSDTLRPTLWTYILPHGRMAKKLMFIAVLDEKFTMADGSTDFFCFFTTNNGRGNTLYFAENVKFLSNKDIFFNRQNRKRNDPTG